MPTPSRPSTDQSDPEDFFSSPLSVPYTEIRAEEHASQLDEYKGHLEKHAGLVAQRAQFMAEKLVDKQVATNITVIEFPQEVSKRREIHKNGLLFRRGQRKVNYFDPEVVTAGWEISSAKTRFNVPRKVILLGTGALHLAENATNPDAGKDNVHVTDIAEIDMTEYPFTNTFTQPDGFAPIDGSVAKLTDQKLVPYGSEYARVAVNLERIEDDLHAAYQKLLGPGK